MNNTTKDEFGMRISDIFAQDLRAHAYVKARGLNPQIVRERQHHCEACKQMEKLPAVLNILENYTPIGRVQ